MTTPYRTPGERDGEASPSKVSKWQSMMVVPFRYEMTCPACEYGHQDPKACTPQSRVGIFFRCDVDGSHTHHKCWHCGMRWIAKLPKPKDEP